MPHRDTIGVTGDRNYARKDFLLPKKSFLDVLEENYKASLRLRKSNKRAILKETYEDLIAIYKANYHP